MLNFDIMEFTQCPKHNGVYSMHFQFRRKISALEFLEKNVMIYPICLYLFNTFGCGVDIIL